MRTGTRAHAHTPHALTAVYACGLAFLKPQPPGAVGKNHQLGHHQIQRFAARASLSDDPQVLALAFKFQVPINATRRLGTAAALFSLCQPRLGKTPQKSDLVSTRHRKRTVLDRFSSDFLMNQVVAQIVLDGDFLHARFGGLNSHRFVVDRHIQRHAGHAFAFVKAGALDPAFRKHRRLHARSIDR